MLRQSLIYIFLSILVVIFAKYAHTIVVYIDLFYTWMSIKLAPIFSHTSTGVIIRNIVMLVLLPVIVACIPALIYRLIKGQTMPYFIELTWCVWLVIVLSVLLIR